MPFGLALSIVETAHWTAVLCLAYWHLCQLIPDWP